MLLSFESISVSLSLERMEFCTYASFVLSSTIVSTDPAKATVDPAPLAATLFILSKPSLLTWIRLLAFTSELFVM